MTVTAQIDFTMTADATPGAASLSATSVYKVGWEPKGPLRAVLPTSTCAAANFRSRRPTS